MGKKRERKVFPTGKSMWEKANCYITVVTYDE